MSMRVGRQRDFQLTKHPIFLPEARSGRYLSLSSVLPKVSVESDIRSDGSQRRGEEKRTDGVHDERRLNTHRRPVGRESQRSG